MKAIKLNAPGGVEELVYTELEIPSLQPGEVLVRMKAISINPVDVKSSQGKGFYGRIKDENPIILGWDISGVVEASKSDTFKIGDEVFGMINFPGHGKAYAEYIAAPANQLAIKPKNISHDEAAAATLAALTAWQVLVHNAQVQPGQKVLIHAASGGVGHFAIQIAKHLGAHVTGTSSAKNKDFVLSLGADVHIDYQDYNWDTQADEYDFVLDAIGGENFERSVKITKTGGTVISIPSGLNEELSEIAIAKGVKGYFVLVQSNGADMKQIASLLEKGIIKAHIAQKFAFEQMKEAHSQLDTGRTAGKIVVTV
ncbi:NADP-dependent oxidoreductase [Pedobacter rhizosphaerae]|uniref:NADPH:quinone reductase n=1 Tax=Pedobacter rhizosphaerae TaxID=390241 RepID=A0A1H9PSJ0_9SPHI|nr:NADP-dependent oxidoreductase [Pedobacter rhizosphaerae]SER51080.1 NADPH:quinone reductase [Pedobacter rhizosphaerae]